MQAASAIQLIEDCPVGEIGEDDQAAWAVCADRTLHRGEIVVGADGYRSIVRGLVEPDGEGPRYAGYVGWRGLVRERDISASKRWPGNLDSFGVITAAGHRLIAYPVPGPGWIDPFRGKRQITFAWYDTEHDDLLNDLGCLRSGSVVRGLSPNQIPTAVKQSLFRLAPDIWPSPWREAILTCIEAEPGVRDADRGMHATVSRPRALRPNWRCGPRGEPNDRQRLGPWLPRCP